MLVSKYVLAAVLTGVIGQIASAAVALRSGEILQPGSVATWKGPVAAEAIAISPGKATVALWYIDTFSPDAIPAARAELERLFKESEPGNFHVAVLQSAEVQSFGPFRSVSQLRTALAGIVKGADSSAGAEAFYDTLTAGFRRSDTPPLNTPWNRAVAIAAFPELRPELQLYASSRLLEAAMQSELRLSFRTPGASLPDWLQRLERLTAPDQPTHVVQWLDPPVAEGFRLYEAKLPDGTIVPAMSAHAAVSVERYGLFLEHVKEAGSATDTAAIEKHLREAYAINPGHPEVQGNLANFYERTSNWTEASVWLRKLVDQRPSDGALHERLGAALYSNGDVDAAEAALTKAHELQAAGWQTYERLGNLYLGRKQLPRAVEMLTASLVRKPDNQPLWFAKAAAEQSLNAPPAAIASYEAGLKLGGEFLEHRTNLIQLYLSTGDTTRALQHTRAVAASLPPEAVVRKTWASFFDRLNVPEEALQAWSRALEINRTDEDAWYRVAQIHLDAKRMEKALEALEPALEAIPGSARLHLAKAEALLLDKRVYAARKVIAGAADSIEDGELLRRSAEMRDLAGDDAPKAWQRYAEWLRSKGADQAPLLGALQRGLLVAVRDADLQRAEWFAMELKNRGAPEGAELVRSVANSNTSTVSVPGGLDALAFVAGIKRKPSTRRFLEELSRAAVEESTRNTWQVWQEASAEYFSIVAALTAVASKTATGSAVTVDPAGKQGQKTSARVLELLGWKLKSNKGKIVVEQIVKGDKAQRQNLASALAVDEIGMQETLQSGKPFTFDIAVENVPVFPPEPVWQAAFYPKAAPPGGLAQALMQDAKMARLYVGLNAMNVEAARLLIAQIGLKKLADEYADRLFQLGASFSVSSGRVVLPGAGPNAAEAWKKLLKSDPADPARFFRELLENRDGKLLIYYHTVGQLDAPRQRFFTRSPERLRRFYDLFAATLDGRTSGSENYFIDFMRDLPLDPNGSVMFPGSPELWLVVKGQSSDEGRNAKLLRKAKKVAAPDEEDEILIRLAKTRYEARDLERSQLDNFLALARIDRYRREPLTEPEAVLLSQQFSNNEGFYPYFNIFTELQQEDYRAFFRVADKFDRKVELGSNAMFGQFESLVELIALAQLRGGLPPADGARLFRSLCDSYADARDAAAWSSAALGIVRKLALTTAELRDRLLPPPVAAQVNDTVSIDFGSARRASFDRILQIQKITPLEVLLGISERLEDPLEKIAELEALFGAIVTPEIPKNLEGPTRNIVEVHKLGRFTKLLRDLQAASRKKWKEKDRQNFVRAWGQDVLQALEPTIATTLAGHVYGIYFDAKDLVISGDPLLVHKHGFVPFSLAKSQLRAFSSATFTRSSEAGGSAFQGSFSGFAMAVGQALSATTGASAASPFASTAALGNLRGADWRNLADDDLRYAGLTIRAGRELVVRSATDAEAFEAVQELTAGLVGFARRQELLAGVRDRDWVTVWRSLTLSEAFFLGRAGRARKLRWASPVLETLDTLRETPAVHALGVTPFRIARVSVPVLEPLPPYEEFAHYTLPQRLAERCSEASLYIADWFDRKGISAAAIGGLVEPLTRAMLANVHSADPRDWAAVLEAWQSLDAKLWEKVVTAQ